MKEQEEEKITGGEDIFGFIQIIVSLFAFGYGFYYFFIK